MTKLIPRHTRQIAIISNSLLVVCLSWRPNFLTSEMSVALITVTVVNLLVSPLTIFLTVLVNKGFIIWIRGQKGYTVVW